MLLKQMPGNEENPLFECIHSRFLKLQIIRGVLYFMKKTVLLTFFTILTTTGCASFWNPDVRYTPATHDKQLGPRCFEMPEDSRCWIGIKHDR